MKKIQCVFATLLLLCGCSAPVYETLGDVAHISSTLPPARQMKLQFPADAAIMTASGTDMLYQCGDYTICLQTMASGDLAATVRSLSGYEPPQVTLLETACSDHTRYDWVWTAAGEAGDVICRAAVLDDGKHHYCLSVSADAQKAGLLTESWNQLFGSFCLEN